jgi:cytochrome c-type biogenesis protein CcsB
MFISIAYLSIWITLLVYVLHTRTGKQRLGQLGTATLITNIVLLTANLVKHAWEAGHWPLTNHYEVSLCVLWTILVIYLLLETTWGERKVAPYVLGVALLVGSYAITRSPSEKEMTPLLPVLRTIWLQLHVITSVIGYGAFGVAAGLGLMHLLPSPRKEEAPERASTVQTEQNMERVVALGFPWFSLGILTGAIWAQKAWGRYWGWDPKETWALITWMWYLLVLHVRSLRNWQGRRLAGLVVFGFVIVIFTFIGVPWLVRTVRLESLHGF